jgi:hypothetical protein
VTEEQNPTTTSTLMTIDSAAVSDEEHPLAEVGHLHETDKNPFMVDAPKHVQAVYAIVRDFAMLSVCTCGESILDEEVTTYQDVISARRLVARQNFKWVSPFIICSCS